MRALQLVTVVVLCFGSGLICPGVWWLCVRLVRERLGVQWVGGAAACVGSNVWARRGALCMAVRCCCQQHYRSAADTGICQLERCLWFGLTEPAAR